MSIVPKQIFLIHRHTIIHPSTRYFYDTFQNVSRRLQMLQPSICAFAPVSCNAILIRLSLSTYVLSYQLLKPLKFCLAHRCFSLFFYAVVLPPLRVFHRLHKIIYTSGKRTEERFDLHRGQIRWMHASCPAFQKRHTRQCYVMRNFNIVNCFCIH